jgi:malate dehydrogenase
VIEIDMSSDEKAMFNKSVASVDGLVEACKKIQPALA